MHTTQRMFLQSILATVLLLCAVLSCHAVDDNKVKLREILDQRDALIVHDDQLLGVVGGEFTGNVSVSTITCWVHGQETKKVTGIYISVTNPVKDAKKEEDGEVAETVSIRGYIDIDELPALSDALAAMVQISNTWDDKNKSRHLTFITRDDVVVGINQYDENFKTIYISGMEDETLYCFFDTPEHFLTIKGLVDKAIRQLNGKII